MDPRKTLVLYTAAGHGHAKAAKAVLEALKDRGADASAEDAHHFSPKGVGAGYESSYLFMIRHVPWFWGAGYHLMDGPAYRLVRPLRSFSNRVIAGKLERKLLTENPDTLVCTHFLPCEVAARMKRAGLITTRLVTVITDYRPHAFWIEPETDVYAVASEETREELERRGVDHRKIRVTGIPVGRAFWQRGDRAAARSLCGIAPGAFTVLLTSGGAGVGAMLEIASKILAAGREITVIAVCGTNAALKSEFEKRFPGEARLKLYGFTDQMDTLMDAADVVLGKGGGLTVSESLAKGRPLILFRPVPGQETRNAEIVTHAGAAVRASTPDEAAAYALELAVDRVRLGALSAAAASLGRPGAAAAVAELALA